MLRFIHHKRSWIRSKIRALSITATLALAGAAIAFAGSLSPATTHATNDTNDLSTDKAALQALYNATGGDNWSNISGWDFTGDVTSAWQGVTVENDRVTELDLTNSNLTNSIPAEIGDLTALTELKLGSNNLTGNIPTEIGNLTNLEILELWSNDLRGPIPTEIGNLTAIVRLQLSDNELSGTIPAEIGNLTQALTINLRYNNLSGRIPSEFGELTKATTLDLYTNQLTGEIPGSIGDMAKMRFLYLGGNAITGRLPSEIGQLSNLNVLDVGESSLSGPLPASLMQIDGFDFYWDETDLCIMPTDPDMVQWFKNNYDRPQTPVYCAVVPDAPSNLNATSTENSDGVILTWDDTNNPTVTKWQLRWIEQGDDAPVGDYTQWLDLPKQNGASHTVNATVIGKKYRFELRAVNETGNSANATVTGWPRSLEDDKTLLKVLYDATGGTNWTHDWDFDAALSASWHGVSITGQRVTELNLYNNNLSGTLPAAIGELNGLTALNLNDNSLIGTLPSEIGNLTQLTELHLADNDFVGFIPAEITNLVNLEGLYFSATTAPPGFEPTTLDSHIGQLSNLKTLYLSGSGIVGGIPPQIGDLSKLERLAIYETSINGIIPPDVGDLSSLKSMELEDNSIKGSIPRQIGNLSNLTTLELENNNMHGHMPAEIGNLSNLQVLAVRDNGMTGGIPYQLGNLTNLNSLALQNNDLSGPIPSDITKMSSLRFLQLNGNQLTGPLPSKIGKLSNLNVIHVHDTFMSGALPNSMQKLGNVDFNWNGTSMCLMPTDSAMLTWYASLSDANPRTPSYCSVKPNAPENLTARATQNSDGVILSWNHTDDPTVIGWQVRWRERPTQDQEFNNWIDVSSASGAPTHVARNLEIGKEYEFHVRAVNPSSNGKRFSKPAIVIGWPFNSENDKAVLQHLYDNTNGEHWTNKTNWDFSKDIDSSWHGLYVYGGMVRSLQLPNNNLVGPLPPELGELTGLEQLILTSNQISGTIPDSIADAPNLVNIDLGDNRMTGSIPVALTKLDNLNLLNIGENQLTGPIPYQMSDLKKLWLMDLSANQLDGSVPAQFGGMPTLRYLRLDHNQLGGALPGGLANLKLVELTLSSTEVCLPTADTNLVSWIETIKNKDFQELLDCQDNDRDGLIEANNPDQFNAIRWDLNGDGKADDSSNSAAYNAAFPSSQIAHSCAVDGCHGYELTVDIDMQDNNWEPIGNSHGPYNARFDGNGHMVANYRTHSDHTGENFGLFGETGTNAILERIYLHKPSIVSYGGDGGDAMQNNAGALVGLNRGLVRMAGVSYTVPGQRDYASPACVVSAYKSAGGLVGGNLGEVHQSWSDCDNVKSNNAGGGLVGINFGGGYVKNSWAGGEVIVNPSGKSKGALVGRNYGTIRESFSLGRTKRGSHSYHGPLTGLQGGHVFDSYYVGHSHDEHFGGTAVNDAQMRTPHAGDLQIFDGWDLDTWWMGDAYEYTLLTLDMNGDGVATPWEVGPQMVSNVLRAKPNAVGDAQVTREWVTLRFQKNSLDHDVQVAGIGYRVAGEGNACHRWSGNSVVALDQYHDATLSLDGDIYTLRINRASSWNFRNGNRVCVDVGFITTDGTGYKSSRRWRAVQMPPGAPTSTPTPVGDAQAESGAMIFDFTVDPYDWTRFVGYRIAKTGGACHDWTDGFGPIKPGQELNGAAVAINYNVWSLSVPVGSDEIMKPNTDYCLDIWTANYDGAAPNGARWKFTTGPE